MPRRSRFESIVAVSWSSSHMRPDVGSIIRLIIRKLVVLPQPDGPTKTGDLTGLGHQVETVDGDGAVGIALGHRLETDHEHHSTSSGDPMRPGSQPGAPRGRPGVPPDRRVAR